MKFEWDEQKNEANIKKHGFDFRLSKELFQLNYYFEEIKEKNNELRNIRVISRGSLFLSVVYVIRDYKVRIISLRRASDEQRRAFSIIHSRRIG